MMLIVQNNITVVIHYLKHELYLNTLIILKNVGDNLKNDPTIFYGNITHYSATRLLISNG